MTDDKPVTQADVDGMTATQAMKFAQEESPDVLCSDPLYLLALRHAEELDEFRKREYEPMAQRSATLPSWIDLLEVYGTPDHPAGVTFAIHGKPGRYETARAAVEAAHLTERRPTYHLTRPEQDVMRKSLARSSAQPAEELPIEICRECTTVSLCVANRGCIGVVKG